MTQTPVHGPVLKSRLSVALFGLLLGWFTWPLPAYADASRQTLHAIEQYEAGNEAAAIRFLIQLAYQGNVAAQFNLGIINLGRNDSDAGAKEARFWFREAAEAGDRSAQFNLGMLLAGQADVESVKETRLWLERAAEGGKVEAQTNLAILILLRSRDDASRTIARRWLELAAGAGDAAAASAVGLVRNGSDNEQLTALLHSFDLALRAEVDRGSSQVIAERGDIYSIPSGGQQPLLTIPKDALVEVISKRDGWIEVRTKRGLPAWVQKRGVEMLDGNAVVRRLEAALYVRPEINPEVVKLGTLTKGEQVEVIDSANDWLQVIAPGRFTGWMRERDVDVRVSSIAGYAVPAAATETDFSAQPPTPGSESSSALARLRALPKNSRTDRDADRYRLVTDAVVFQEADANAVRAGSATAGSVIEVTRRSGGYAFSDAITASGWVFGGLIDIESLPEGTEPGFGRINRTGGRVRAEPNLTAAILKRFTRGEEVEILVFEGAWANITLSPAAGWVSEALLEPVVAEADLKADASSTPVLELAGEVPEASVAGSAAKTAAAPAERLTIAANAIVYSEPLLTASALGRLAENTELPVLPSSGPRMVSVTAGIPRYGWIYASLVQVDQGTLEQSSLSQPINGIVTGSGVRVRLDPDTSADNQITSFGEGEQIRVAKGESNWLKVLLDPIAGYALSTE